jgi:hypothetical protein
MIQNHRFGAFSCAVDLLLRVAVLRAVLPVGVAGAGGRAPRPRERVRSQVGSVVCRIPVPSAGGVGVI